MPPLHAGWVEQALAHVLHLGRELASSTPGNLCPPAMRAVPTISSVGLFTFRNAASLKKSELNMTRSTERTS